MIVHLYIRYNTILNTIFQYGLEAFLIHWKLIGFEAKLENKFTNSLKENKLNVNKKEWLKAI